MTTALSFQSPSDRMSFLRAFEIETKDPKEIITSIGRKIFKEGETKVTVTLGKKSVIVTKEKIPEFIKSLITKSTKSLENQKDLFELLSKTFALRPILEKKTYRSLVNSQFKKLSSLLDKSIEQEKGALTSPSLDEEAREKALAPILEQGTEMLDLLGALRLNFAEDQETSRILGSFFTEITKKITALFDFSDTGSSEELQAALAPLMFAVELIEKEEDLKVVQDQLKQIVEPIETEKISRMAANATTPVQQTAAKTYGVFLHAIRGILLLATAGVALFQNKIPVSEGGLESPPGLEKQFIGSALVLGLSDLLSLLPVTEKVLEKIGSSLLQKVIYGVLSFYGGTPIAKIAANMAVRELLKKAGQLAAYHTVGKSLPSYQQKFLSSVGNFVLSYATGYCAKRVVNEAFSAGSEIFTRLDPKLLPQIGQVALPVFGTLGLTSFAAVLVGSPMHTHAHTFEDMNKTMKGTLQDDWEQIKKTLIDESWATFAFAHTQCEGTHSNLLELWERAVKAEQEANKKVDEAELSTAQIEEQKKTGGVKISDAEEVSSFLVACKEKALQAKAVAMMSTNRLSMMPYIRIGGIVKDLMNISWEDPPTETFIRKTSALFVQNIGFMYKKPVIAHDEKIYKEIQEKLRLLQTAPSPQEAWGLLRSLHELVTKTLFDEFVNLMYHPLPMDDDVKILDEIKRRVDLLQKTQSPEQAKKLQESIEMLRLVIRERLDLYKEIIDQSEHLNKVKVEDRQQVFYRNGLATYTYACSRWEASLKEADKLLTTAEPKVDKNE